MENNIENQGGLSASHLKELEGVISQILTNQEIIMQQNKDALDAKKKEKIWGIIKFVIIWIAIPLIMTAYLPQMIESMMGQIGGVVNKQIEKTAGDKLNIDTAKIKELEQLLR